MQSSSIRMEGAMPAIATDYKKTNWPIPVLLESPYAGDIDRNVRYARKAMHDCFLRGEAPFASHLLYTQPGVLDDTNPTERTLGIEAGLVWGAFAVCTVVYCDLGLSHGMHIGIERAQHEGRPVQYRYLGEGWDRP
jgi:hypothetical protein